MEDDVEILEAKLRQAAAVIAQLTGKDDVLGGEGKRALEYFNSDHFDPAFLPWPKPEEESIRPEDLNATNDD